MWQSFTWKSYLCGQPSTSIESRSMWFHIDRSCSPELCVGVGLLSSKSGDWQRFVASNISRKNRLSTSIECRVWSECKTSRVVEVGLRVHLKTHTRRIAWLMWQSFTWKSYLCGQPSTSIESRSMWFHIDRSCSPELCVGVGLLSSKSGDWQRFVASNISRKNRLSTSIECRVWSECKTSRVVEVGLRVHLKTHTRRISVIDVAVIHMEKLPLRST